MSHPHSLYGDNLFSKALVSCWFNHCQGNFLGKNIRIKNTTLSKKTKKVILVYKSERGQKFHFFGIRVRQKKNSHLVYIFVFNGCVDRRIITTYLQNHGATTTAFLFPFSFSYFFSTFFGEGIKSIRCSYLLWCQSCSWNCL